MSTFWSVRTVVSNQRHKRYGLWNVLGGSELLPTIEADASCYRLCSECSLLTCGHSQVMEMFNRMCVWWIIASIQSMNASSSVVCCASGDIRNGCRNTTFPICVLWSVIPSTFKINLHKLLMLNGHGLSFVLRCYVNSETSEYTCRIWQQCVLLHKWLILYFIYFKTLQLVQAFFDRLEAKYLNLYFIPFSLVPRICTTEAHCFTFLGFTRFLCDEVFAHFQI